MTRTINRQLTAAAYAAWSALSARREARRRFVRYTYGDQWGDMVTDNNGRLIREGDLVAETGRQPLTNNLIRRLVKTIVGRYRNLATENGRYDLSPGSADSANQLPELDARLLEEYLISGQAIQRVCREKRRGREGVWVDNVNPALFFTNRFTDPRGHDLEMAGMLHSMSLAEVLERFGGGKRRRMERIRGYYGADAHVDTTLTGEATEFFNAPDGRCRVIELWTLEAVETARGESVAITFKWRCRWLTPHGDELCAYDSPWRHGGHPFVMKFYPYTDGEVHPFVEDVLDQQRYINRLIVLIDKMMGASAKGVLLFPVDQKPSGLTWEEICARWSAADGVIPIQGRSQTLPQQISGNGGDAGAHRLLELELKLFEDVSGVSDALLGKAPTGNEGTALYESRIANSTVALADILDTFTALTDARNKMIKEM